MVSTRTRFHLQVVTSTITPLDELVNALVGVLDAGADTVQLRDHSASPAQASALAEAIEHEVPDARDRLIVHERLIDPGTSRYRWRHRGAPGSASDRAGFPDGCPFGASVHSLNEARLAVERGAAYLTFGHVFRTGSHPGQPPRGVEALAAIVGGAGVPVLAIGGITADNVDSVLATGCAGIAVISAILSQPDPQAATGRLRTLLDSSPHQPCYPFPDLASPKEPKTHARLASAPGSEPSSTPPSCGAPLPSERNINEPHREPAAARC